MKNRTFKHAGFTLVELLVVIGIIALLMSILLPSLSRAREQANQIKCLSNLRTLGHAVAMYQGDNGGHFPKSAVVQQPTAREDWIFWQPTRDVNDSSLARYLGLPVNEELYRCPSDLNWQTRAYRFSYVLNKRTSCINAPNVAVAQLARKVTQVRRPAEKLLMYEEDERTVDDGHGNPDNGGNLLAIRHDFRKRSPDNGMSNNSECRGNILFCDNHAGYVDRNFIHKATQGNSLNLADAIVPLAN
ncbi:MAG TPA: type II secretion system protein [Humisphaera sp.]